MSLFRRRKRPEWPDPHDGLTKYEGRPLIGIRVTDRALDIVLEDLERKHGEPWEIRVRFALMAAAPFFALVRPEDEHD